MKMRNEQQINPVLRVFHCIRCRWHLTSLTVEYTFCCVCESMRTTNLVYKWDLPWDILYQRGHGTQTCPDPGHFMLQNQKHVAAKPISLHPSRCDSAACGMPVAELHSFLKQARWWFGRHKASFVLLGELRGVRSETSF